MPSKQVIVIRTDLDLSPGKAIAQGAHASLKSYQNAPEDNQTEWGNTHNTKITLGVDSETALINLADAATDAGLPHALIEDKGGQKSKKEPQPPSLSVPLMQPR